MATIRSYTTVEQSRKLAEFLPLKSADMHRGYYDALKWVYEHTYGDNYKLSVKDKMQKFVKE